MVRERESDGGKEMRENTPFKEEDLIVTFSMLVTTYRRSWRVTAVFSAQTSPGKGMAIAFIFSLVFKCRFR